MEPISLNNYYSSVQSAEFFEKATEPNRTDDNNRTGLDWPVASKSTPQSSRQNCDSYLWYLSFSLVDFGSEEKSRKLECSQIERYHSYGMKSSIEG